MNKESYMYIDMYVYLYSYIYMLTPHELPTLVLCRSYAVKPAFPAGLHSVSLNDYQTQTHMSIGRARQLVQVRRQPSLHGNTARPIQNQLFLRETNKNQ